MKRGNIVLVGRESEIIIEGTRSRSDTDKEDMHCEKKRKNVLAKQ